MRKSLFGLGGLFTGFTPAMGAEQQHSERKLFYRKAAESYADHSPWYDPNILVRNARESGTVDDWIKFHNYVMVTDVNYITHMAKLQGKKITYFQFSENSFDEFNRIQYIILNPRYINSYEIVYQGKTSLYEKIGSLKIYRNPSTNLIDPKKTTFDVGLNENSEITYFFFPIGFDSERLVSSFNGGLEINKHHLPTRLAYHSIFYS